MKVVIATPLGRGGKGGIDRIMDALDDELRRTPMRGGEHRMLVTRGQRSAAFSAVAMPLAIARLAGWRVAGKVDLVHINLSSHGSTVRKIALARACRALGIPYVLHLHGSRMRQYWTGASPRQSRRIRKLFAHAARVIVLGEVWRRFVVEQVPQAAGRIVILPNATPAPHLPPIPGDRARILFLGLVGERKGTPQLIEALSKLPRDESWRAVIAGNGEVEKAKAAIAAAGLGDHVTMPGWVGPADAEALLAASDILTLPSFDENLPMSVIEAMGAGLAVVATPVGATEEIIHPEKTGLLVPPGDVAALTAALSRLVADSTLRQSLGRGARAYHAAHLEIGPYARQLAEIWRAALA